MSYINISDIFLKKYFPFKLKPFQSNLIRERKKARPMNPTRSKFFFIYLYFYTSNRQKKSISNLRYAIENKFCIKVNFSTPQSTLCPFKHRRMYLIISIKLLIVINIEIQIEFVNVVNNFRYNFVEIYINVKYGAETLDSRRENVKQQKLIFF